jgi:hypothetical protein
MSKQPKPKSSVIYSGPSLLDGKPIVCIAIVGSGNVKTGNMVQTHIIRADISPMDASKTGEDISVCGTCMHRGNPTTDPTKKQAVGRSCYVTLYQGPTVVYKGYKRGIYPTASPVQINAIGSGRMVRLGSYGDPSAVPQHVWDNLLLQAVGHTGYTHQHSASTNYNQLMHSADTIQEASMAHSNGVRTFRVIPVATWKEQGKQSLLGTEILCPASVEAGNKATCITCKLCTGSSIKAKSIAIVAHGTSKHTIKG